MLLIQDGKDSVAEGVPDNPVAQGLNKFLGTWVTDQTLYQLVVAIALVVLLVLIYLVFRFLIFRPIARSRFASKRVGLGHLFKSKVLASLAGIVAIVVIDILLEVIPKLNADFLEGAHRVVAGLVILAVAQLIVRGGRLADMIYSNLPTVNRDRALRGYVTVGSVLIYIIAIILVISTMLEKSPVYFLTGLGAMSAILIIVFRDTLLSMFANVIVTTGDLVRVGDWIDVNNTDANGFVVDMSLNVVKIQNFDKTISSLPTYTLIQNSFVNYRGMFESGGRRISRSLILDQQSVRTLSAEELDTLRSMPLVAEALNIETEAMIHQPELSREGGLLITNTGLFRQYVTAYLKSHPRVRQDMMLLVRQMQPDQNGLPIQVYCFVNDTSWVAFEGIQSAIFDHLISMIPVFGLRIFQAENAFSEPDAIARVIAPQPEKLLSSGIQEPGHQG